MTISSAKFTNPACMAVVLSTVEAGSVLVFLEGDDFSGGWRAAYDTWIQGGGAVEEYEAPEAPRQSLEDFISANGYTVLSLINLKDIEDKLRAASVDLPAKSAAVRSWISSVQVAYAQGGDLPSAPHSYQEVLTELLPYLES